MAFLYFLFCYTDIHTYIQYMHTVKNLDPRVNVEAGGIVLSTSLHQINWWHAAQALINRGSSTPHSWARQAWLTGRATHRVRIRSPDLHSTKSGKLSTVAGFPCWICRSLCHPCFCFLWWKSRWGKKHRSKLEQYRRDTELYFSEHSAKDGWVLMP